MGEHIQIMSPEGEFSGYVALPAGSSDAPAVVVLHEVFGVNFDMRQTCDELAAGGLIAICPDLFWRLEPGLDLNHWTPDEWAKGLSLYEAFDRDAGVRDITNVVAFARSMRGASGAVGVTGFCLGGLMTFLTAARTRVDAAVAYYGGGTEQFVDEMSDVADPLMMHLGERDEFIDQDAQAKIRDAAAQNKAVTIHSYPGCSHAFARHTGTHFDAEAAALANGRTRSFFNHHLRP